MTSTSPRQGSRTTGSDPPDFAVGPAKQKSRNTGTKTPATPADRAGPVRRNVDGVAARAMLEVNKSPDQGPEGINTLSTTGDDARHIKAIASSISAITSIPRDNSKPRGRKRKLETVVERAFRDAVQQMAKKKCSRPVTTSKSSLKTKAKSKASKARLASESTLDNSASSEHGSGQAEHRALTPVVLAKAKSIHYHLTLIDQNSGLLNIDDEPNDTLRHVHMPLREFVAALRILAVDFELDHPGDVHLAAAQDMARVQQLPFAKSGILDWVVVDFTKTCDLEQRAKELIQHLPIGTDQRSLLAIICDMQSWHRRMLVRAGMPDLLFRADDPILGEIALPYSEGGQMSVQQAAEFLTSVTTSKAETEKTHVKILKSVCPAAPAIVV